MFNKYISRSFNCINCRLCHVKENVVSKTVTNTVKKLSHPKSINNFFVQNNELNELKKYIPEKYLKLQRKSNTDHLYLICPKVAKAIVSHLKPHLSAGGNNQIICETNAGLGLIATELLENGIPLVRLYESCSEFRTGLKEFGHEYPGRVQLFTKDIFLLSRYAYMDKQDQGYRVELLLKDIPKHNWIDAPAMTIIGPMPTLSFVKYLLESLALQNFVVSYGRTQLFAIMKPRHVAVLSATPKDNLHVYLSLTILFNLIFDYEVLDEFPRNLFLPWEPPPNKSSFSYYPARIDVNKMYLVKINFKRDLPVLKSEILPLQYFVKQFYGKGKNRVIPTVEKWVPGSGLNLILPKLDHKEYFNDMDIFTQFRELTPNQILAVFREMINYPTYQGSPFTAMIENELIKYETVESSLAESPQHGSITEVLEEKFDTKR